MAKEIIHNGRVLRPLCSLHAAADRQNPNKAMVSTSRISFHAKWWSAIGTPMQVQVLECDGDIFVVSYNGENSRTVTRRPGRARCTVRLKRAEAYAVSPGFYNVEKEKVPELGLWALKLTK